VMPIVLMKAFEMSRMNFMVVLMRNRGNSSRNRR
jgi:hypothetical protein